MPANELYPVFLKEHLHFLIVGGGNTGLEKLSFLLKNSPNARVTLVANKIDHRITRLALRSGRVKLVRGLFHSYHLEGIDLVIIAVNKPHISLDIRTVAREHRLLCNVADQPALCDFYLGSIVSKGNLKIAISTNGRSPTLAKRLREILETTLPDEIDDLAVSLGRLRKLLKGEFSDKVHFLNELTSSLLMDSRELTELEKKHMKAVDGPVNRGQ